MVDVEERLRQGPDKVRLAFGCESYRDIHARVIEQLTDTSAEMTILCSPSAFQMDQVGEYLVGNSAEHCRVPFAPVPDWIIIDGDCAIMEQDEPGAEITYITSAPVVNILAMCHDFLWWPAAKYEVYDRLTERRTDQRTRYILAQLADGVKDETAAQRLGMSVRTYRRHVADLYSDLGANSRFQAGMRAERALAQYWNHRTKTRAEAA